MLQHCVEGEVQAACGKELDLSQVFTAFTDFWGGCRKAHQEKQSQQDVFGGVKPVEVCLGPPRRVKKEKADGTTGAGASAMTADAGVCVCWCSLVCCPVPVTVQDKCMVVPFAQQLTAILSNERLSAIITEHQRERAQRRHSEGGTIRAYYDGAMHKAEPFLTKHVNSFVIDLYYDDVTVTDPLSSYEAKVFLWPLVKPTPAHVCADRDGVLDDERHGQLDGWTARTHLLVNVSVGKGHPTPWVAGTDGLAGRRGE